MCRHRPGKARGTGRGAFLELGGGTLREEAVPSQGRCRERHAVGKTTCTAKQRLQLVYSNVHFWRKGG